MFGLHLQIKEFDLRGTKSGNLFERTYWGIGAWSRKLDGGGRFGGQPSHFEYMPEKDRQTRKFPVNAKPA